MTPKALITGASGLLGREVLKSFKLAGWEAVGTANSRAKPPSTVKLNILDHAQIVKVLDGVKPSIIVHCAANRFPDTCSKDPVAARAINVEATHKLAIEAYKRSIFLIYISTDYVFSGKPGEAPYKTDAATSPPNVYGETKLEGEKAILEAQEGKDGVSGVVLRVPILYGHCEKDDPSRSAIHAIVDSLSAAQSLKPDEPKIKMDSYCIRYPTSTEDIGRVCVDIADLYTSSQEASLSKLPKILQYSSEDSYTKYEMCELFAKEILGIPLDNIEAHDPTKDDGGGQDSGVVRPYNTHLDTSTLASLGINVNTMNFLAWWKRELRAFRH